jgi:hypothetical protein
VDFAKGIHSIEAKLEAECQHFSRLEKLFGSRQNITPSYVLEPNSILINNTTYDSVPSVE